MDVAKDGNSSQGYAARLGAVALLALAGGLFLLWPMSGDEALFYEGARRLSEGGTYYLDFWDVKQPGVYWFHQIGLGIGEIMPRLAEVALALLAGWMLSGWLARVSSYRWTVVLGPLLVLGPYLLIGHLAAVGQAEGIVCALLVMQAVLLFHTQSGESDDAVEKNSWRSRTHRVALCWALAGMLAGLGIVLKHFFILYSLVFIGVALYKAVHERNAAGNSKWRAIGLHRVVPWLAGVITVLLLATLPLIVAGAGNVMYATTLAVPAAMAGGARDRLAEGWATYTVAIGHLGTITIPLTLWSFFRTGWRAWLLELRFAALGGVMVTAALALVQLPTHYRLLPLAVFLGLAALPGLDAALQALGNPHSERSKSVLIQTSFAALVLVILVASTAFGGIKELIRTGPTTGLSAFPERNDPYTVAVAGGNTAEAATMVAGKVHSGERIYVLGDPRIYRVTKTRQAIPVMGWSPELMSTPLWNEIVQELDCAKPSWIFVESDYTGYVMQSSLAQRLNSDYQPTGSSTAGTWWKRVTPQPSTAPCRVTGPLA